MPGRGDDAVHVEIGADGVAAFADLVGLVSLGPVLGVPVMSKALSGQDSLLSIVQMPKGIPVATFAIGEPGAANAALFAVAVLAGDNPLLAKKLAAFRQRQVKTVLAMKLQD